jgi:antitoxin PrlF
MIIGKITAKAQTTIPQAVRRALGLEPGDAVEWEIEGARVTLKRVPRYAEIASDPFVNNFAMFDEWASEADRQAFDNL